VLVSLGSTSSVMMTNESATGFCLRMEKSKAAG
jgi:hypothetical protein